MDRLNLSGTSSWPCSSNGVYSINLFGGQGYGFFYRS